MSQDARHWGSLYHALKHFLACSLLVAAVGALWQEMRKTSLVGTSHAGVVPGIVNMLSSAGLHELEDTNSTSQTQALISRTTATTTTRITTTPPGHGARSPLRAPAHHKTTAPPRAAAVKRKKPAKCSHGASVTPLDFGARGDGIHDDTKAVRQALLYGSTCAASVVIGPKDMQFLVMPGELKLELHDVFVRFDGMLLGPTLESWNPEHEHWPKGFCAFGETECHPIGGLTPEAARSWWSLLHLVNSTNVTLEGSGGLKAPGQTFWTVRNKKPAVRGYCLLKLEATFNVKIVRLAFTDSPMYHLVVTGCRDVDIDAVRVTTQYKRSSCGAGCRLEARNTDGVSIISSGGVTLRNSDIESGDDNLVIKGGSRRIHAEDLRLFRGKGLAIGSLGERGMEETVKDVVLRNISIQHSQYGFRVKTWRGGRGTLSNVTVALFNVLDVKVGISIDQTYCASTQLPGGCAGQRDGTAVQIQHIRVANFSGTYWKEERQVRCIQCSNISYERVHLKKVSAHS